MPLHYSDQVKVLTDILTNHQADCCGSVSECEQMERLIESLLRNDNLEQNSKEVLQQVYDYSQIGVNSTDLDQHIESHQQELSQWVVNLNQLT